MSIKLKHRKLEVNVYDPSKASNKRYVGRFPDTRQGMKDAKEAEANAIKAVEREHGGGQSGDDTVTEFRNRWQEDFPMGQRGLREQSTWIVYMEKTKPFADEFPNRTMRSFTFQEASRWAQKRPHHARAVQAMFSDALRDGQVDFNPFMGAHSTRSRGRADIEVVEYDKFLEIVAHAERIGGLPFKVMTLGAGLTAMREGEWFGVAIEDFDVENQEIDVRYQWRTKTRSYNRPKNHERRVIYCPPAVLDAARPLLLREITEGSPIRDVRLGGDGRHILLLTPTGKPYTARTHDYYWRQVRQAAGVPEMKFHDLKHFAASYYLNVLEIDPHHIMHQIAHKDLDLLLNLYGHPSEKKAREAFRRAFGGNVQPIRAVSEVKSEVRRRKAAG